MSKNFIGKMELIDALAKSSNLDGVSKKTIATVVNELLPTIVEIVKNDKKYVLSALEHSRKNTEPQGQVVIPAVEK